MRDRGRAGRRRRRTRLLAVTGVGGAVLAAGLVAPQAFAGTFGGSSAVGASGGSAGFLARWRDRFGGGVGNGGGFGNGGGLGNGGGAGSGNDGGGTGDGGGAAGGCSDVELIFARGTGEAQGLGVAGAPLARALAAELPGRKVTSFAVVYAAAANQASAGPGATNMTKRVTSVAAACPETRFVLGGYSQGASVTDIAIGIQGAGTRGDEIPDALKDRVAAIVVFGNPLGIRRQTIAGAAPEFAGRAEEFCATGDPVCGGGNNFAAHLSYPRNGDVQRGAEFAAGKIG